MENDEEADLQNAANDLHKPRKGNILKTVPETDNKNFFNVIKYHLSDFMRR